MTNQSLMLVSIVLCSLGGWYVVLTKYLELKAMTKNKSYSNDSEQNKIDPVSPDFHKMPEDFNLDKHVPGMGPPPHPSLPFSIPDDLLAMMNKLRPTSKLEASTSAKHSAAAAPKPAQPATVMSNDKREICNWATILHLSGLAIITGIPFLNIVIPSILWLLKKEQHPFLAKQGRDVINFQITFTLIQFLCLGVGALFIWLAPNAAQSLFAWTKTLRIVFGTSMHLPYNIFTVVPFFWGCVVMVRGAVAAYNGTTYKYPYSQPFLLTAAPQNKQEAVSKTPAPSAAPVFNNMNFS
jgi:uncharacterized Tic20 family protein